MGEDFQPMKPNAAWDLSFAKEMYAHKAKRTDVDERIKEKLALKEEAASEESEDDDLSVDDVEEITRTMTPFHSDKKSKKVVLFIFLILG